MCSAIIEGPKSFIVAGLLFVCFCDLVDGGSSGVCATYRGEGCWLAEYRSGRPISFAFVASQLRWVCIFIISRPKAVLVAGLLLACFYDLVDGGSSSGGV